MLPLLILASVSRCAAPMLCPTDEQLLAAVRSRDGAVVQAVANQAAQDDPNSVILVHSERIRRIADVLCSDALPNESSKDPTTINCAFVVQYRSRNAHTVARMVRGSDGWRIDEALTVTRRR
ncbi:hypothetical protein NOVOSPHI9U_630023 [Novosphingobium sp. 9U]|nr:hypothetical protein NOVOSPHI9U_630023 [Novosphingobium sp. 9U]